MIDKDLFLHDLAVVTIIKNEGRYLKEWLDYHLLAGVDHFYLYDNDSPDNQAEVAEPYVKAGLVDYIPFPGQAMQYIACNDALKKFKFHCRYMAFIDGDEFIFPKTNRTVTEVIDEILSQDDKAAGLAIHWHMFDSNDEDKADYSRGVLERFTRRAPNDWYVPAGKYGNDFVQGNCYVKNIVNPRRIKFCNDPHRMNYFEGFYGVDESLTPVKNSIPEPVVTDKIVINHYYLKSREEFMEKVMRGSATRGVDFSKKLEWFDAYNRNDEFDDWILKYRDERKKIYLPPEKYSSAERVFNTLMKNFSPILLSDMPQDFYAGKLETFLTCRAASTHLKNKIADDTLPKFFEEASLKAIVNSVSGGLTLTDKVLFIKELPALLKLQYPIVKDLRDVGLQVIDELKGEFHSQKLWKDYTELDYISELLEG